jgi:RNA polymerase sigma factor (sigma-70 family)
VDVGYDAVPVSDVELLSRWRDGDRAAGGVLFERHFRPLYRFFRTKVGTEVEDLVQETLLACVRGRDRLRSDASFRAYLFGVARRVLFKHYRDRGHAGDFTQASVADVTPGAGSVMAKREDDRIILEALRSIPLEYQIAVELHDYEGLSGPEIAAVLDVPEGTIRSRIRRGRIQLRERIAELAGSPVKVQTTLTRLEDWADAVRNQVLDARE